MDMLDKIGAAEFLGSEFLLWLWFASEVSESELPLPGGATGKAAHEGAAPVLGLWLDDQLLLSHPAAPTEKATLKGIAPSGTPEAKEALRQGKMPDRAHLGVRIGEREWGLTLDAATLSLTGVKLPELLSAGPGVTANEGGDEVFYERMMLMDQIEEVIGALFERFARMRMARGWAGGMLPAIQLWLQESDDFDPADAKRRVARALRA